LRVVAEVVATGDLQVRLLGVISGPKKPRQCPGSPTPVRLWIGYQ